MHTDMGYWRRNWGQKIHPHAVKTAGRVGGEKRCASELCGGGGGYIVVPGERKVGKRSSNAPFVA